MTIETKYENYQLVWYIDGGKAKRDQITAIEVTVADSINEKGLWIRYGIDRTFYSENELYPTKEELIASL